MEFRWLVILVIYTLLIGPVLDTPFTDANARAKSSNATAGRSR